MRRFTALLAVTVAAAAAVPTAASAGQPSYAGEKPSSYGSCVEYEAMAGTPRLHSPHVAAHDFRQRRREDRGADPPSRRVHDALPDRVRGLSARRRDQRRRGFLTVTRWRVRFVVAFAVAVRVATTLSLRRSATSLRAGRDRRSLVLFVEPAGTEKRAVPSVIRFLRAAAPGTSTRDAVTSRILPTQLPMTPLGQGIGTRISLPRLTTSTRTLSLTPVKVNGTSVLND
jgi:hypothetical protein